MASLVIGIDGGASNTVALLAEASSGRVLGRGSGGPSNIQAIGEEAALRELNHAVSAAFKTAGLPRKSVAAAAWSPDGRWLAFVTEREANVIEPFSAVDKEQTSKEEGKSGASEAAKPAAKQIWLIAPDGGEAWPLTKSETDVGEFQWTKDGKGIVFTAAEAPSKAGKARKERYSSYDVVEKDFEQQQLWWIDAEAGTKALQPQAAKQLTSDPTLTIKSFAISAQSDRIAFSAGHNPLRTPTTIRMLVAVKTTSPESVR